MEKTNLTVDDIDLIDKYLKRELELGEKILVEQKLAEDEEWRDAFLFQKEVEKTVAYLEADSLRTRLLRYTSRQKTASLPWLWAASVSFLILTGFIFHNSMKLNDQGLFTAFFEPYTNQEMITPHLAPAFTLYESGNYLQALEYFNSSDEPTESFFAAQCLLSLGQTNAAIRRLERLAGLQTGFSTSVRWYLGLASLKAGRKIDARAHFKALSGDELYGERAKNILAILK